MHHLLAAAECELLERERKREKKREIGKENEK